MEAFHWLAVQSLNGLNLDRYLEIFLYLLLFGILGLFVWFFWVRYKRIKEQLHTLSHVRSHTENLIHQQYIEKSVKLNDKALVVLLVEYLEKFCTNKIHSSLVDLFVSVGFDSTESEALEKVFLGWGKMGLELEKKVRSLFK